MAAAFADEVHGSGGRYAKPAQDYPKHFFVHVVCLG
jgi:hypothetical protein